MRSIGVLHGMRKGKHATREGAFPRKVLLPAALLLALTALFCLPSNVLAAGDVSITTRNDESTISRDPATGDRVMKTPDAKPQPEYQGPQTVIVAPEVYPDRRPGSGANRPPSGSHRPRPRQ